MDPCSSRSGCGHTRLSSLHSYHPMADGIFLEDPMLPREITEEELLFFLDWFAPHSMTLAIQRDNFSYSAVRPIYSVSALCAPSLLLCGIREERDWQQGLSVCHRCVSELYENGREFNGCLPRGVRIDTPELLHEAAPFWGCDFFCIDYDRLAGKEEDVASFLERHETEERRLLCRSRFDPSLAKLSIEWGVREIYLPKEEIPSARQILKILNKKQK